MKKRPARRKRQFSKKSASLTVEFLERRVVLNADPTGGVLITGSPFEGQALTASNNIVDADGLGSISYQWKSASDPIPDATSPTYVLQDRDVGNVISVVATYTDLLGTEEVVSSQPTVVIESSSPLARQSSAASYSPDYTSINGGTSATMCRIHTIHRHQRLSCLCFTGRVVTAVNKAGGRRKMAITDGKPLPMKMDSLSCSLNPQGISRRGIWAAAAPPRIFLSSMI